MLPQIRAWFSEINALTGRIHDTDQSFAPRVKAGEDLGGSQISQQFRDMARVHSILHEFQEREIQVKDLQRGLIDFPALLDEQEIFLCWEHSENEITHWHNLESGFAGRKPLWH
ncbi:uncharacterized protein METZ01_LOCUS515584 [marine metagenome]|uniref:DUF2203 domain-containing protein n=1 Tax=marine metagenome TaxID=408172 RepID=A0A383F2G2_9ZZZZ